MSDAERYDGKTEASYYMGVDLGQSQDYTAIAIIEHIHSRWAMHTSDVHSSVWAPYEVVRTLDVEPLPGAEVQYNIVHLERVPLGTSYPDIVDIVGNRFGKLPAGEHSRNTLLVDATGVGKPVVDMLRPKGLRPYAITITGGNSVNNTDFGITCPKRDLVGAVQVTMQSKRLKMADGLREGPTLVKELQSFSYKISTAGNDTYGAWREGTHDDLVLAIAIALWWARRKREVRVL